MLKKLSICIKDSIRYNNWKIKKKYIPMAWECRGPDTEILADQYGSALNTSEDSIRQVYVDGKMKDRTKSMNI